MKNLSIRAMVTVGLLWFYTAAEIKFEAHELFKEGKGSWGQTGVGDFDKDGKLDFVAGVAFGGQISWWRNTGDLTTWEKHSIHKGLKGNCVGGDAADMDGDGWVDWVSSGYWFKNHGEMTSEPPEQKPFNGGKGMPGKSGGCHDIVVVDIDGDGHKDVMNHGITWWKNPGPENMSDTWKSTKVYSDNIHGGIAPYGYGDIDGDGDMDIVEVQRWHENVNGDGSSWKMHKYTEWGEKGKYGWEFRVVTADFDGDKDLDIAIAEGDAGDGTAAWIQNMDGKGTQWETHELPFDGVKGDMHSIGAQDFDNDGDMDIAVPKNGGGSGNEWSIFENIDGKGTFQKHEVYKGFGSHETVFGDFDGDGDIDIVGKCWCGGTNFVLLENKLEIKPPGVPGSVSAKPTAANKVEVSWAPPTGSGGNLKYIIYRNAVALDTVITTKYVDETAQAGGAYSVSAFLGGKESEKSAPQEATAVAFLKAQIGFQAFVTQAGAQPELKVVSEADGKFSIELYSMQGDRLAYESGQGRQARGAISLQGLNNGIYFVRLSVPQGTVTQRIILSR